MTVVASRVVGCLPKLIKRRLLQKHCKVGNIIMTIDSNFISACIKILSIKSMHFKESNNKQNIIYNKR